MKTSRLEAFSDGVLAIIITIDFASMPVADYGVVLLAAACAYQLLCRALISHHGTDSPLAQAVGTGVKGWWR